ncbi:Gtr1/RagA G protein conserved region-domain-containing protein [Cyathus striatus]|nr:Gtr1/RagA G protein conserved region-domain-containing protein [Cyathus striatus]
MAPVRTHPSYAATSSSSPITHRPSLNGNRSTSYSATNPNPIPRDEIARTKILLLGLRRSFPLSPLPLTPPHPPSRAGKSSIYQVLFNDLPSKQSFYLEATMRIQKHTIDTVIPLEIWDCPGNITVETLGAPLSQFATMIFVIDIRDLYNQPISKLVEFIVAAYHQNPNIYLEVFVHKAEKLQEDDKIENFRQIHERVSDRLLDISPEYEQMQLNFHLTSVYDHSLHEAFSRVLHKLIDSLPYLEELLNVFCANSQSPKAFLFDTKSRLYVATDASPVDSATHNLCCDYLQMLNSFGPLYKSISASPPRHRMLPSTPHPATPPPTAISPRPHTPTPLSPLSPNTTITTQPGPHAQLTLPHPHSLKKKELFYPSAATHLNSSSPGSGTTLTYHLITPHLALLALLPTSVYEGRRGLVEYNVVFFREGVQEIVEVEREVRREGGGNDGTG